LASPATLLTDFGFLGLPGFVVEKGSTIRVYAGLKNIKSLSTTQANGCGIDLKQPLYTCLTFKHPYFYLSAPPLSGKPTHFGACVHGASTSPGADAILLLFTVCFGIWVLLMLTDGSRWYCSWSNSINKCENISKTYR
jgi:hypothetical protein